MRPWLRRMLILGALTGVVYAGATVKIGPRPAFGHAYQWVKRSHPVRTMTAWLGDRWDAWFAHDDDEGDEDRAKAREAKKKNVEPKRTGRSATTAEVEAAATPKRVAALESAAREAFSETRIGVAREESPRSTATTTDRSPRSAAKPAATKPTKTTKIDERLSKSDKKSLDDLVSSRVAPR